VVESHDVLPIDRLTPLSAGESLWLDLVRGLAAQAVLIGHALAFLEIYPAPRDVHPLLVQNGGVVVFFVLSGFLISYTVFKKRRRAEYTLATYIWDRFCRIGTAYLPALVFIAVLDGVYMKTFGVARYQFANAFDLTTLLGNVVMLQDHPIWNLYRDRLAGAPTSTITSFGSGRPLWTVAIEWWLYMFYGIAVFWAAGAGGALRRLPLLCALLVVPLYNIGGRGNGLTMVWYFGVCILLLRDTKLGSLRPEVALAVVGTVVLAIVQRSRVVEREMYDPVLGSLFAAVILFALIALRSVRRLPAGLPARGIRFMADYSFSLYLVHYSVLLFFEDPRLRIGPWMLFAVAVTTCNLVAILFASATEFHHRKLRVLLHRRLGI
jgi:Predicted acyltransferases